MPIALDPNQAYPVYLQSDSDKSEAERPAFLFRYLTVRKAREVDELLEQIHRIADAKKADSEGALERLANLVLGLSLADWRNIPVPFSHAAVDDVVTWSEKWELVFRFRAEGRLSESDRKKSASPPISAGVDSAKTAGVGDANSPATANQSASESPAPPATETIPNAATVEVQATLS